MSLCTDKFTSPGHTEPILGTDPAIGSTAVRINDLLKGQLTVDNGAQPARGQLVFPTAPGGILPHRMGEGQ